MESSSKEKNAPSSSHMNIKEGSPKAHHHSPNHHRHRHRRHHHNLNRPLLFRVPHHNYNVQHSQKKLGPATSTSHGKTNPPSKFGHKSESRSGNEERKEKASRGPDRIRSNTLVIDVIAPDARKMLCGLCSASTSDASVVAVLLCGHVYHAECLETRTPYEDRRDPPCPLCMSSHTAN